MVNLEVESIALLFKKRNQGILFEICTSEVKFLQYNSLWYFTKSKHGGKPIDLRKETPKFHEAGFPTMQRAHNLSFP